MPTPVDNYKLRILIYQERALPVTAARETKLITERRIGDS